MERQTGNDQQSSTGFAHSRYSGIEDWHFLSSQGGTEWSRPLGMEGRGREGTGRWKVASVTDSLLTPSLAQTSHFLSLDFEIHTL